VKTPSRSPPERACRRRPSRWLKDWILEVQNGRCLGCTLTLDKVEFDHIIPLGLAGADSPDNWAALCPDCHRRKTRADLRKIAKAKRQRRFHETGRSRAPAPKRTLPGIGAARGFDRCRRRGLNGVVSVNCDCSDCKPRTA
jgi:5-methylcytosine-specific restriction endonuclease McrA